MPKDILFRQHGEWGCNACITANELAIVICKPQKGSYVLDAGGSLPRTYYIQFALDRSDSSGCYPLTKELQLSHMDKTF